MEPKITTEELKSALMRSGYLLESRLISTLLKNDYIVSANDVYKDKLTSKSREVDLYACSKLKVVGIDFHKDVNVINVCNSIVVECQNNPQPVVFFKKDQKPDFSCHSKFKSYFPGLKTINQNAPLTDKINATIKDEFDSTLVVIPEFHYNNRNISSQYCSFMPKKKGDKVEEWFAAHPDGLNETFGKLFNFINARCLNARPKISSNQFFYEIFYPVVVLQGDIYEVCEVVNSIELTRIEHKIFEFNYYDDTSHTLLVDIVSEKYFDSFLKRIRSEKTIIENILMNTLTEIKEQYQI